MKYYFSKVLNVSFEEAIERVTSELKKQEFGVLTTIDLKEKFKDKLNVEFKKYTILGACNPALAHQALEKEDKLGLLLPCNVVVQEKDEGQVEISIIDPVAAMQMIDNKEIYQFANLVQKKIESVIESL